MPIYFNKSDVNVVSFKISGIFHLIFSDRVWLQVTEAMKSKTVDKGGPTFFFLRFYLFIFRERGREGERERNISVWLPLMWPPLGTWPATQACAPTGNRTANPLVCSPHSIHRAMPARAEILFTRYTYLYTCMRLCVRTHTAPLRRSLA